MRKLVISISAIAACMFLSSSAFSQSPETSSTAPSTIRLDEFMRSDGYLPVYKNERTGQVLFEIKQFDEDILYFPYTSKSPGIANVFVGGGVGGGASLGLDYDIPGFKGGVIRFQRVGNRVAVELQNLRFREDSAEPALERRLKDQVSSSVLAMLPIVSVRPDSMLVDIAPLVIKDAGSYAVQAKLFAQLDYRLDPDRSYVNLAWSSSHPEHTEIDVWLTFASEVPSAAMNRVAQDAKSLTIGMRHAFVKAPVGMQPRKSHPLIAAGNFGAVRINYGTVGVAYMDVAARYDEERIVHLVNRYRLEKKSPEAKISDPLKPITIYFDPRFPEPFRSAAMQGALNWSNVLEAAGFSNAIEVKVADDSVDPLDIFTNYIFWSEDDSRGTSQGETFLDQRTGEIISFKVRIDSQRIRYHNQVWTMMRGAIDQKEPGAITPTREEYVAHRIKMLVMHEIGHGLGLGHNMSASVTDRASIMDYYSGPRFEITEADKLKFQEWHVNGAGAYDIGMIRYLYTPLTPGQEEAELSAIISDMQEQGLILTNFYDARWVEYDDYADPIENLQRHTAERDVLVRNYDEQAVDLGDYMGAMRDNLQFAYLYHRVAIKRGVKNIGGYHETFAKRGDSRTPFEFVSAETQRMLLDKLMYVIRPEGLAFPEGVLELVGPSPVRRRSVEEFGSRAGDMTDPLSAARTLVAIVVHPLLAPDRAQRLMLQNLQDENQLGLEEMIDTMLKATWQAPDPEDRQLRILQQIVRDEVLTSLAKLGADPAASPEVRAIVRQQIKALGHTPTVSSSSAFPHPKGLMY